MDFTLTKEQRELKEKAKRLAREFKERASYWDETEEYPHENVKKLVEAGFMGMTIPKEYGGGGRPLLDAVLVIEEIAKACTATARIVVEGNTGTVGALIHYGTEEQKSKYLPWVCREGEKPAIAITEPEAGSAATDLSTGAAIEGDHYVISGEKCWITGAGVSRLYLVFARFEDIPGAQGIGGILVERGTPGFEFGRREKGMGVRGLPEGTLIFTGCCVPEENLLVSHKDEGFKKLMRAYNGQRLGAAAVALGVAQGAFDLAVGYAKEREQFGRPLCEFQGLQWIFADLATKLEAARLLIYRAAANAGFGFPSAVEAAMAKAYAAELVVEVTNAAIQIHGSRGYSREWPLERLARDARMFPIAGGSSQMLKNLIASRVFGRRFDQRSI